MSFVLNAAGFLRKNRFVLCVAIAAAIGVFLRLYRIGDQIIWDDEWHGIQVALSHPLGYIFTHFHADDNCIPLSAYFRVMLDSLGLNELLIRAPSLLAGFLMLFIFPWLARKLLHEKAAIAFVFMLSASPLLVYYSRLARPYSIVVLTGFIAVVAFYLWMIEGKTTFALVYLAGAVVTPYFSLSALALVLAPVLYATGIVIFGKLGGSAGVWNRSPLRFQPKHVVVLALATLVGIAAWVLPAAGTLAAVTSKGGRGVIDLGTLGACLVLFGGARSYMIASILMLLFIEGAWALYSKDKRLFSYVAVICTLQFLFVLFSRPFLLQAPIIIARYLSSLLPFWLLGISIGLCDLGLRLKRMLEQFKLAHVIPSLLLPGLLAGLFWNGPIREAYSYPNSFTNHLDFQYNYLRSAFTIDDDFGSKSPEFYTMLSKGTGDAAVVEFPGILSWSYNPFHIYQKLHRRRVFLGYWSESFGPFFGYETPVGKKANFRNFVDLADSRRLRGLGAAFVIVHKNIYEEAATLRRPMITANGQQNWHLPVSVVMKREEMQAYVLAVQQALERNFGPAYYEDERIVVYSIATGEVAMGRGVSPPGCF